MFRFGIYISERQVKALKREAIKSGLRMSELIRRAIDQFLKGLK